MDAPGKRGNIVRAALELFVENGFHGAPMAMIADKAGVGAGTIYRYFKCKDELITELFDEMAHKLVAALQANYDPHKPLRERFIQIGKTYIAYAISHPLDFRYMELYQNSPYGIPFRRARILSRKDSQGIVIGLFDEAIAQQVIKDLPLPTLIALAFGPLKTVIRDHIFDFFMLYDALIVRTIEACWDGIKR